MREEVPSMKPRGLEDLDILGEALMKQNMPANAKPVSGFQKPPDRVPLNVLAQKKALDEMAQAKETQSNMIRKSFACSFS